MARTKSKKQSKNVVVKEVIGNIDLLIEILLRLPALSLIGLKLVSKSWLAIISDPNFAITHSRRNSVKSSISHLYLNGRQGSAISFDGSPSHSAMTFLNHAHVRQIMGDDLRFEHSCNGLVLIRQMYGWNHIVVNPTTCKYRLIVMPIDRFPNLRVNPYSDCFLYMEPLKSPHQKVVIMPMLSAWRPFRVLIFSSETNSWKDLSFTIMSILCCIRKIYWNGSIYWLNQDNNLVRFDVETEKFIEYPLSSKHKVLQHGCTEYFGESRGRFFLIQCCRTSSSEFYMLEMDINTHSWFTKHRINMRPLALQFSEMHPNPESELFEYSVLYVKSGNDMKSFSLVLDIPGAIVVYDMKKGKTSTKADVLSKDSRFSNSALEMLHENVYPLTHSLNRVM